MEDIVRSFFAGRNGSRPVIPKTMSGTLRFDIKGGKRFGQWLVTFNEGIVSTVELNALTLSAPLHSHRIED